MRFQNIYILIIVCLLSSFVGCTKAGKNEIISQENETTSALSSGWNNDNSSKSSSFVIPVLTEDEAAIDHLTVKVSDQISIDAYITPSSYYTDGIGVWEIVDISEDDIRTWVDMEDSLLLYGHATFGEFVKQMNDLTDKLGNIYRNEWELVKGSDDMLTFCYRSSLEITTPSYHGEEAYTDNVLWTDSTDLDFLSAQTVCDTVTEIVKWLYPNVSEHFDIVANTREYQSESARLYNLETGTDRMETEVSETADEWYSLTYYVALDEIPLKSAHVSCHIPAGRMAEDSALYSDSGISAANCPSMTFFSASIADDSFTFSFKNLYTWEQYQEKQEVIEINEILQAAIPLLADYDRQILVDEIELVMAETETQKMDKYRPVWKPYWTVNFYMTTIYSEEEFFESYQLVFDGYTGELVYQAEIEGDK